MRDLIVIFARVFAALVAGLVGLPTYAAPVLVDAPAGYQHTTWTQENGVPGSVNSMVQTTDGWIWLSTDNGLYRFDGVAFEPYVPPGRPELAHVRTIGLSAAPNGDLYVSFLPKVFGVVHRDGSFEELPPVRAERPPFPSSTVLDRDGTVWVLGNGIYRYAHGRWTQVDGAPASWAGVYRSLLLDQDGRLWASTADGVWQLDRARGRFAKVSDQGGGLAQSPDGAVWVVTRGGGPAVRVAPSASGKPRPAHANQAEARLAGLFDARGTLWAMDCMGIACLVRNAPARGPRLLARRDADTHLGTGRPTARSLDPVVLEDREGDVWIAGDNALHRFRPTRFIERGFDRDGGFYSMAPDGAGRMWVAETDSGKLWQLQADGMPVAHAVPPAAMLAPGSGGSLLLGAPRSIRRVRDGAIESIPLPPGPDGKPNDHQLLGLLDDGKVLWTATAQHGAIGWYGGRWLPSTRLGVPNQRVYLSQVAAPGKMWLVTADDQLVLTGGERPEYYDATPIGFATGIFPGPQPAVGGNKGFAILKDGRLQLLHAADPDVLRNISGLAVTRNGDRWLNGGAGVVHVTAQDWQRAVERPDEPLRYRLFGPWDGYPGRAYLWSRQATAFSADGRHVWFLASGGVVGLDSTDLPRNTAAPRPHVLDVTTDAGRFAARDGVRLPAGTDSFRVRYTVPLLRQPERVRFEYRLDGVDAHWQDAGTRRLTSYTNVAPGDYMFRVRAINEDGVASPEPAVLRVSITPTLVQSLPFKIAAGLSLAALAALLHRMRVRYLTKRLTERLLVRLTERERIARALHDTILQSVQVLMLRLHGLAKSMPAGDRMRRDMESVLNDTSRAIGEGRDQVHDLRSRSAALEDVVQACAASLQPLHPDVAFELRVEGRLRTLHAAVADEAGLIAAEAVRNAFTHAQARRVSVRIEHGRRALVLTVRDDGRGLDAAVARAGYRNGHWGLVGMRERAMSMGARFELNSRPGRGTTVTLSVPAARAYVGDVS